MGERGKERGGFNQKCNLFKTELKKIYILKGDLSYYFLISLILSFAKSLLNDILSTGHLLTIRFNASSRIVEKHILKSIKYCFRKP